MQVFRTSWEQKLEVEVQRWKSVSNILYRTEIRRIDQDNRKNSKPSWIDTFTEFVRRIIAVLLQQIWIWSSCDW